MGLFSPRVASGAFTTVTSFLENSIIVARKFDQEYPILLPGIIETYLIKEDN